jgi:hypothetical protein
MEQIYEPNSKFNFDELTITKPLSASTGTYISKYSICEHPLYIQPPKCSVKQIVVKTGKRMYCDLVFHQENEQFIQWMENLENKSQHLIFKNREKWFQTELEMDDIENSFTSPMKVYKSGKSYIIRTNIPTRLGKPMLKIYNEDENDVSYDDIKEGTNVMAILEIQGIRCSSRSFQIDIEIKQMMVLKTYDLFNTCILKKSTHSESAPSDKIVVETPFIMEAIKDTSIDSSLVSEPDQPFLVKEDSLENQEKNAAVDLENNVKEDHDKTNKMIENMDEPALQISTKQLEEPSILNTDLCEVDFNLDEMPESETVSLKKRNDVYYEMYKEARQKAKVARDLALSAYLEAKRIKNTYMLDDIIDSSDDDDSEDGDDEDENSDEDDNNEHE